MGHRVPLEPWQGTWGSSRVGGSVQGSSQVAMGPPVDYSWDILSRPGMFAGGGGSVLLQWVGAYSVVLAWVFTLDIVGVNSVVVVCSGFTSCGVQAPLLWCEVHIY